MTRLRPALSVDEWMRLNRLLELGLDLDKEERAAWLAGLGSEPPRLREALTALLARSDAAAEPDDSRPPAALARVAADALAALQSDRPGQMIGPWRLDRLLAEGGMGSVWLAERADGLMRRTAALKLPRSEWIDRGLSERIARERAILARLQHPNIAVLYDAGVSAEGRPYLALEYVQGQPIDAYCRAQHLELKDLLRLFLPVVRAVSYAHSRLVIHRDIKPGNILVTVDGQPMLLDFGVSKLIEGENTAAEQTALTQLAGRPLTLPYAAPEQLRGSPLTVAVDVYALGVVLFELTTGTRLYRSTTPYALEQEILAGDVRRPSDATSDRQRARELHGDLDAIILNALKRQPEERYASATALADDLERYLGGQPVEARPYSRAYRLRKLIIRNRLPVAAAVSIVIAVGIGAGLALWQANVAREQAAEATALNTFVFSLIKTADPNASQQAKRADLATLAAIEERVDREFLGSPAQLLRLRVTLGDAYRNRAELPAAKRAYRRAAEDADGAVAPDDLHLLAAQVHSADPRLITSMQDAHRLARAIAVLRTKGAAGAELLIDALLIHHQLSDEFGVPEFIPLAHRFDALGEALEVAAAHFGEGSAPHLRVLRAYAGLVDMAGDRAQARRFIADGLAQGRQRLENHWLSSEYRSLEADHHAYQCGTEAAREGITGLWHALDAIRARYDETSVQMEETYAALALCYERLGDVSASWFYRAAYDVAAARDQPPSVQLMRRAARAMDWAIDTRDAEAAEHYRRTAVDNAAAIADPVLRSKFLRRVAMGEVCLLYYLGHADDAERAAAAVLQTLQNEPNVRLTHWEVNMRRCLSYAQRENARYAEAAQTARHLLDRCHDYGEAGLLRCRNRGSLALAFARLDDGDASEALAILDTRLKLPLRPDLNPESALARGRALLALGRTAEATHSLQQLYGYWVGSPAPTSVHAAEAEYWLARAYLAGGDQRGHGMLAEARRRLAASPLKSHRALAAQARAAGSRENVAVSRQTP